MLQFIKNVDEKTKFTVEVFGGAVLFECRTLSPIEAEAAGLSSSLVASAMFDPRKIDKLKRQQQKIENMNMEDPSEDDFNYLLNVLKGINPDQLLAMEHQQNKILCEVIKRASEDQGQTWEQIHIVQGQEQQDPARNILWVGMITKEDRKQIIDLALSKHKEVASSLQTFRSAR